VEAPLNNPEFTHPLDDVRLTRALLETLLEDFRVEEWLELDAQTMNPARVIQLWARS
jgi:hypothetical protein